MCTSRTRCGEPLEGYDYRRGPTGPTPAPMAMPSRSAGPPVDDRGPYRTRPVPPPSVAGDDVGPDAEPVKGKPAERTCGFPKTGLLASTARTSLSTHPFIDPSLELLRPHFLDPPRPGTPRGPSTSPTPWTSDSKVIVTRPSTLRNHPSLDLHLSD